MTILIHVIVSWWQVDRGWQAKTGDRGKCCQLHRACEHEKTKNELGLWIYFTVKRV